MKNYNKALRIYDNVIKELDKQKEAIFKTENGDLQYCEMRHECMVGMIRCHYELNQKDQLKKRILSVSGNFVMAMASSQIGL